MSKKSKAPNTCYGTTNQVAELMKLGYAGKLMLGVFGYKNQKGGIVVPAIKGFEEKLAPTEVDEKEHSCTFIDQEGCCKLREQGISLKGCSGTNKIKEGSEWIFAVENKGTANIRKRWLKPQGLAIVRLFVELSGIGKKKDVSNEENNDN